MSKKIYAFVRKWNNTKRLNLYLTLCSIYHSTSLCMRWKWDFIQTPINFASGRLRCYCDVAPNLRSHEHRLNPADQLKVFSCLVLPSRYISPKTRLLLIIFSRKHYCSKTSTFSALASLVQRSQKVLLLNCLLLVKICGIKVNFEKLFSCEPL